MNLEYCEPVLSDEPGITIEGGRHPVVEKVTADTFVANDVCLNLTQKMLIITGPNMGGKSTYMRQTALITLLALCGSHVPATAVTLGPIDRIFTRIGSSDDLAGGRSTFMVEMTETANILHNATENSLVLMDEIGRGTSTFDGLSLAWAASVYIAEQVKAYTLFATHYFELTILPETYRDDRQCAPRCDRARQWHRIPACRQGGAGQPELWPAGSPASRDTARSYREGPRKVAAIGE